MKRWASIVIVILLTLALSACGAAAAPEPAASSAGVPAAMETTTATSTPTAVATAKSGTDASSPSTSDATTTPATFVAPTPTTALSPTAEPRQAGAYSGIVFTVGGGSEITFTVGEQLTKLPLPNDAVLRTDNLTGDVSLDGGVSIISVNLHSLRSDQTFRDRYVQRTMFPDHRFATLTIPSILPLPGGFADGDEASVEVTGTLTVKSADVPVIFDVVARDDGHTVFILAKTTVTWAQLQMPTPTARSVVSVEDEIRVEVLLAVQP